MSDSEIYPVSSLIFYMQHQIPAIKIETFVYKKQGYCSDSLQAFMRRIKMYTLRASVLRTWTMLLQWACYIIFIMTNS